mmetsp:Transcript_642/g.2689  ORF Transcript_642/g.2689 Transcript_642/m.2689 type:complete len:185 (+) Transcript_642:83-637(+)
MKTSVKIALHLAGLCGVAATVPETCTGSECEAPLLQQIVNAFVPYYTYEGALKVSGFVMVVGAGNLSTASQTLSWKLSDVDPKCETPPAEDANPNACGIHIHEGMSCTENAGDHFYNKTLVSTDPWIPVKYLAVEGNGSTWSTSARKLKVVTGLSNDDVLGHTMIVHNSTGGRIACGILNATKE